MRRGSVKLFVGSRKYLNRFSKAAQKFSEDPFCINKDAPSFKKELR